MRIAIIGGGASGVLSVVHLARFSQGAEGWRGSRPRVILYDDSGRLARGAAYSTGNPAHLLNVPVGRMSAVADDPDHFLTWLRRDNPDASCEDYRSRREYGNYLEHCLATHARGIGLVVRHSPVSDVIRTADGWQVVHGRGGDRVDAVVLAMGFAVPASLPGLAALPGYVADPWAPDALERLVATIPPGGTVLAVGTGLTAVDVALSVVPTGRQVVAVSRHALLPAPQRVTMPAPVELSLANVPATLTAESIEGLVRRHVAGVVGVGGDWRAAIEGLRPVTAELWRRLPVGEKAMVLRTTARQWETVRHRMAPQVARCIDEWRRDGRFEVRRGEVLAAKPAGDQMRVFLRANAAGVTHVDAAAVVNCTGPSCEIDRYPLGAKLRERRLVRPDRLGLGIDVTDDGAAIDSDGNADPTLRVVGALRRGALYESTAIPELRTQAAQISLIMSGSAQHVGVSD